MTGLGVVVFDWITSGVLLDRVYQLGTPVLVVMPAVGLLGALIILRFARGASPATADEYVANFHRPGQRLPLSALPWKLAASISTLGLGGALGFEGPSIYLGAAVGTAVDRSTARGKGPDPRKVLMIAGAAAGVSAIFKTPATGVLFALEVPYQEDLAAHAVLPAVLASATSYLVFAAFQGTSALFPVSGNPAFNVTDLLGAAALGVLAGIGARAFAALVMWSKRLAGRMRRSVGWLIGGIGLALLAWGTVSIYGQPLSIGPGYNVISWLGDPHRSVGLIALLLGIRVLATAFTLVGGGAGGLFIPLVVLGACLGRLFAGTVDGGSTLFPVVGAAAFLGAGYRTPLAALMFVAESTGRPGFVVPGLIATAIAQLMMGPASVSAYQEPERRGHVERRFGLKVADILMRDPVTLRSDVAVADALREAFPVAGARALPVVDEGRYLGMVRIRDMHDLDPDRRASTPAQEIVRPIEPAQLSWDLERVARLMERESVDSAGVVDDGVFVGVVRLDDLIALGDLFRTRGDQPSS